MHVRVFMSNVFIFQARFTESLKFYDSTKADAFPIYRITDTNGEFIDAAQDPNFTKEQALKMYKDMCTLNTMDKILYDSQRQGRISFYMTNFGEEVGYFAFR